MSNNNTPEPTSTSTPAKPPPTLPQGTSNALQGLSETFSFHRSPESFITSRVLQLQRERPELFDERSVVRVKILNRDVAVVSSYEHIVQVLHGQGRISEGSEGDGQTRYVAGSAYDALMAPFFPGPNLLLVDGDVHRDMRRSWDERMEPRVGGRWNDVIRKIVVDFSRQDLGRYLSEQKKGIQGETFDLYEEMKNFGWRVLLGLFLNLQPGDALFEEVERLQEVLLRGQFSLMPVSVNTGFWKSARRHGIEAREKLQDVISKRLLDEEGGGCGGVFGTISKDQISHVANHVLMMTSSLAVKGLASLLTAFLLNLTGFVDNSGDGGDASLISQIRKLEGHEARRDLLESVYLETERLSPPIVGIMRRAAQEGLLVNGHEEADVLVPKGWDVWLYFVGAARDEKVFGKNHDLFEPRRYCDGRAPQPLGFGLGSKSCLGQELIKSIVLTFAEQVLISEAHDLSTNEELGAGVKGWLGWAVASPEEWAADMKQLPTQRPTKPVLVHLTEGT